MASREACALGGAVCRAVGTVIFSLLLSAQAAAALAEARDLVDARRFHAATAVLTNALGGEELSTSARAEALQLRARCHFERRRLDLAYQDAQQAHALDASNPETLFLLGIADLHGWSPLRDPARGLELLLRAGEAGHAKAYYELALIHLRQSPPDYAAALEPLQQAARLGEPTAMFVLGQLHQHGLGTAADPAAAFGWYQRSAEAGDPGAQYALSWAYRDGNGTAADPELATRWLQEALAAGFGNAHFYVGYDHEKAGELLLANYHYWLGAHAGSTPASINLGLSYLTGRRGLPQSFHLAHYWFARAGGAPLANRYRARMLEHGLGRERDLAAALAAYEAAAPVMMDAKAYAALFYALGRGTEPDPQRAAEYLEAIEQSESAEQLTAAAWALATHPAATAEHARLALKLARRAVDLERTSKTLNALAAAHAARGRFRQAVRWQKRALAQADADVSPTELADLERELQVFRSGTRWVDVPEVVESDPLPAEALPLTSVSFVGEIVGLFQAPPGFHPGVIDLNPEYSPWAIDVLVERVEEGHLPRHLSERVLFHLHSPTELLARLRMDLPVLSFPEGPLRFTLQNQGLAYELLVAPE